MQVSITKMVLAAVAADGKNVSGIPVFYAEDEKERARIATILSRVLEAVAHDLGNGVLVIVKH